MLHKRHGKYLLLHKCSVFKFTAAVLDVGIQKNIYHDLLCIGAWYSSSCGAIAMQPSKIGYSGMRVPALVSVSQLVLACV